MMKVHSLIPLMAALFVQACGSDTPQGQAQEKTITTSTEGRQSIAIHDTLAFLELVSADYVDSKDYGKSSQNRTLRITGRTNFPDGMTIKINTTAFVPSTREENASDTYANATVKQGFFEAMLNPWNVPQSVEFRVFKSDQPAELVKLLGEAGERIQLRAENKGEYPNVCFFRSGEIQINAELISSLKSGKPVLYEFQKPSAFKQPYEQALAYYAKAWHDKNWDRMASYTQRSQKLTAADMAGYFDGMELLGFKIVNASKTGDGIVQNMYAVKFEATLVPVIKHKGVETQVLIANVVKEGDHWGVNVTSTFRGMSK